MALGGSLRRNPWGRELPIARAITLTEAGRAHPLLASRPAVFDALCSHLDEIETLPTNSEVLAANVGQQIETRIEQVQGQPPVRAQMAANPGQCRPLLIDGHQVLK